MERIAGAAAERTTEVREERAWRRVGRADGKVEGGAWEIEAEAKE